MSDIKKLLESLSNIETPLSEGKPIGHDYKFKDYMGATDTVRKQKPGVLATTKQTNKLVGDGDGDGGATEESAQLDEDMVAQMAQEFADFLKNKQPAMDNMFPAAEDRDLSARPDDRELTSEAKPKKMSDTPADRLKQGRCVDCGQDLRTVGRGDDGRCRECESDHYEPMAEQTVQPSTNQPAITNIATQLSKLLGMDANQLRAAYRAPKPTVQQLEVLAIAFKKLAAADPQVTVKAMTLLKKIEAEGLSQ